MHYLLSYDLNTPGQKWTALDKLITGLGGKRVLESQWLVVSAENAPALLSRLGAVVDQNDGLLVTQITSNSDSRGNLQIPDSEIDRFFVDAGPGRR